MNKNFDIILAPVITEKSSMLANENKYVFKVVPTANKTQIKQAIESIFTTANSHPKKKRVGKYTGMTNKYKKVCVRLANGDSINFD